jgi:hypothetical protein
MVVHDRAKVGLLTSSPQAQLPIICVHFGTLGCIYTHFGVFAIITYHLRSPRYTSEQPDLFSVLAKVIFVQITF